MAAEKEYLTVGSVGKGEYTEKKSRFLGEIHPVSTESEAAAVVAQARKRYYDARHHCYAWVLGEDGAVKKASDDGEPSGTAGRPILDVIERKNLKNVLVVVIRYFGGVKLGASGLVRAYAGASAEVLSSADVIEKTLCDTPKIIIDYPQYGGLASKLTEWETVPVNEIFEDKVTLSFEIPVSETESFHQKLIDTLNGRLKWSLGNQKVVDRPVVNEPL